MTEGQAKPATPAPDTLSIAGWDEFVDSLRDLPAHVFQRVPEALRKDPQVRQEVGRRMLSALAFSTLDALGRDVDFPMFLPLSGLVINIGQPNADTFYRMARIAPTGTYRLRGHRGSLRLAVIAQLDPFPGEPGGEHLTVPGPARAHHDLNELRVDADGRFDVLLSPSRPEGYMGDWWQLEPTTNKLMLRMVKGDWAKERDATLAIERVDGSAARPRRSAEELADRLGRMRAAVAYYATVEIDHVEKLRQGGHINSLTWYDTSQMIGLAGQFYFEGAYELADDEALIVESEIPADCDYWSVIMTNSIFETTDWYNNHSALNDTQARLDADGKLRLVISARDPGVPNWLDTAGYETGEFQGRWFGTREPTIPTMRKVAFPDIRKELPPDTPTVTPEERDRLIRERRRLLQERPLW